MEINFLQPFIRGKTISLRPLSKSDFEALYKAASDPLIWIGHPAKSRYRKDVFECWFENSINSGGALVIEEQNSGQLIGSSRYY